MSGRSNAKCAGKALEHNPLFNCAQAAAHTGMSVSTIRKACQRREIPTRRKGSEIGKIFIRYTDLEAWIMATTIPVAKIS